MEIEKRVSQLEQNDARRDERWKNHDTDAENRQKEIRDGFSILREEIGRTVGICREDIKKIFDKIDVLQCGVHEERMKNMHRAIIALEKQKDNEKEDNKWFIALLCGTPGIILAVIKIIEIFTK